MCYYGELELALELFRRDLRRLRAFAVHVLLQHIRAADFDRGMEVVDPTPDAPLRRYKPVRIASVLPDDRPPHLKPGFGRQSVALRRLVDGEARDAQAATMEDAYLALVLAEAILCGRA